MKKKTANRIAFAVLAVCLLGLAFLGGYVTKTYTNPYQSLEWVLDIIGKNYVVYDEQTGKIKEYSLEDFTDAIVLQLLDRYSAYYTKEEFTDVVDSNMGNKYGVGLYFSAVSDDAVIMEVAGNSPAERAGIAAGGTILSLEYRGTTYPIASYHDFADALGQVPYAEDGSARFTLQISYPGQEEPGTFSLQREPYVEGTVWYRDSESSCSYLSESVGADPVLTETEKPLPGLDGKTAYVRLSSFMGQAYPQFAGVMEHMKERGRTELILDLRGNGGGSMDILTGIARYLIEDAGDQTPNVARAEYKSGSYQDFLSESVLKQSYVPGRIAVLADANTASASECLIGAMLDYGTLSKSELVITDSDGSARTYGKGIMQTTYVNYTHGDALKLTTAYIYWPKSHTSIHGIGIATTPENEIQPSGVFGTDAELNRALAIMCPQDNG